MQTGEGNQPVVGWTIGSLSLKISVGAAQSGFAKVVQSHKAVQSDKTEGIGPRDTREHHGSKGKCHIPRSILLAIVLLIWLGSDIWDMARPQTAPVNLSV